MQSVQTSTGKVTNIYINNTTSNWDYIKQHKN